MKNLIAVVSCLLAATMALDVGAQADVRAILADTSRPQEHRDQDAARKPAEVLAFLGVGSGARVADLLAGSGYWTRLLVPLVGPTGRVYAGNNAFYGRFYGEAFDAFLKEPKFSNVVRIDGQVDALPLPKDASLDAVLMVLAYHDLFLGTEDRAAMNRAVLAALKPGGVFVVIDHSAAAGAPTSTAESLHRIDEAVVVREVTAVGFQAGGEGGFLRNTADDRSASVFAPAIQGKTDRFVLKFVKPR
jgi:predicted methyltransferase